MNPLHVQVQQLPAGPTSDTVRIMAALARRGRDHVMVRQKAAQVVQGVQEKDYLSEALAIYNWCNRHKRYTRDPYKVEYVRDPEASLRQIYNTTAHGPRGRAALDCDDVSVLIGAMCMAVGLPIRYVTVGFHRGGPHSHTFPEAQVAPGRWVMLDPVAGSRMGSMARRVRTATLFGY